MVPAGTPTPYAMICVSTGALPLVRRTFSEVPISATAATAWVAELMMADAAKVAAAQDAPLYTEEEARETAAAISVMVPYERQKLPLWEVGVASMIPLSAGYTPGAVSLVLGDPSGRWLLHPGDVSNTKTLTVEGAYRPSAFTPVDAVITESTYADVMLPSRKEQVRLLAGAVGEVIQDGGRISVPTFALGGAQEILVIPLSHQRSGLIPTSRSTSTASYGR